VKLLVVGGSGFVGGLVLPYLKERFDIRVFDARPPADDEFEYVAGDVCSTSDLEGAAEGMDRLLYMAMGKTEEKGIFDVPAAYDVNAKAVHLAMEAAAKAGVARAVYTSSLSVFDGSDLTSGAFDDENVPPSSTTVYGLTKWMGEEACRFVSRDSGMPTIALRLYHPVSPEEWRRKHDPAKIDCRTSAPDLARAIDAALEAECPGFEVINITGDTTGRAYRHEKAKRLLGWEPL
jgi:nucleoside-diphosphate-sugar epimerase